MSIRIGLWVLLFAAATGLVPSLGLAGDVEFATTSEFSAWEQRVKTLERRLASLDEHSPVEGACVDDSCGDWGYSTPGLTFLAELLLLRAYNTDADFDSDSDSRRFKESVRLTAGWTTESGLGIRGRWFEYDLNTIDSNLLLQVVDVEVTSRLDLGPDWYAAVSGGGRYAEWSESGEANQLRHSLGPIVGLELGRHLTDNVSLFAGGRQGLVFGKDFVSNDLAVFATEIQLGADLHYALSGTTTLMGRVAWEGQFWTGMSTEDAETLGLTGLVLSVGLTR